MTKSRRLLQAISICVAMLSHLAASGLPLKACLTDDSANVSWHVSEDSGEMVWVPEGASRPAMSLKKNELVKSITSLKFESDAAEVILSVSAELELTLPMRSGSPLELEFTNDGGRPTLKVNGQELPAYRGVWIGIAGYSGDRLVIVLPKAKYATVTAVVNEADPPIVQTASQRNSPSNAQVPAEMIEIAKKSVFQIRLYQDDQWVSSGTGFLIAADGFAVTNSHVMEGGTSAKAVFNDDPQQPPAEVELWSIRPDLDIALIKVPSEKQKPLAYLQVAKREPKAGEDVWAIGYPKMGWSVTKGIVNGIKALGELPQEFQSGGYAKDSRWIQTDCTLNHGNSGGPMLDRFGQVVGLNTWYTEYEGLRNVNFTLSCDKVNEFLKTRPRSPAGFAAAKIPSRKTNTSRSLPGDFPTLGISPSTTSSQIVAASNELEKAVHKMCVKCEGRGSVIRRVQVGRINEGTMTRPVMENRTFKCETCKGKGEVKSKTDVIEMFANNLVKAIAGLDLRDAGSQDALMKAYKVLSYSVIGDAETWLALNDRSRSILGQRQIEPKTPIVFRAAQIGSMPGPTGNGRMIMLQVFGTEQVVILTNPITAEELSRADRALVGGLVAGVVPIRDGKRAVIIEGGFLVAPSVPKEWLWWYQ